MTIHWCGTGLSAIPLRVLIKDGQDVLVWNRSADKAQAAVGDLTDRIKGFDTGALAETIKAGDVVVSMLPGDWHVPLAEWPSRSLRILSALPYRARNACLGRCRKYRCGLGQQVGLDPGIDHLMAHHLVEEYRASAACEADNALSFISYCGGIPKIPNPFRYKFSWSPLGVLKALRSPSKSIRDFAEYDVARPWDAISSYTAPLPVPESFEVYPNRDSLPCMAQYHFDPSWKVKEFVRGTLRLNGWSDAWADVFAEIETLSGEAGEAQLKEMSDQFWAENAYDEGEPDRVVLCVSLRPSVAGMQWHKTYVMDAWGMRLNRHGAAGIYRCPMESAPFWAVN